MRCQYSRLGEMLRVVVALKLAGCAFKPLALVNLPVQVVGQFEISATRFL